MYLHARGIPYRRRRITLSSWMEDIPALVGFPVMPVLLHPDGRVLQDSTPILRFLEDAHPGGLRPDDDALRFVESLLEDIADEQLPRLIMHTRWGTEAARRTASSRIARRLTWGHPAPPHEDARQFIESRQSGFDTVLGLTPAHRAAADAEVDEVLGLLDAHLARFGYLLGDRPTLADCAWYGPAWAHWYQDPASAPRVERHIHVCAWLDDLTDLGDLRGDRDAQVRERFGPLASLDALWPTLSPLLRYAAETWLPIGIALGPVSAVRGKRVEVDVRGATLQLACNHYRAWAFEQVQQAWLDLAPAARAALQDPLTEVGLLPDLVAHGVHHNGLYDGLTPPVVVDGIGDARVRHRRGG